MTKWRYGDSWEKYPIIEGEIWIHIPSGSKIAVGDLRHGVPEFMLGAEMVYCDPPWSKGNANSFITKAGLNTYVRDYCEFMDALFKRIAEICPRVTYLEIGKQHLNDFVKRMQRLDHAVQVWPITYYRKNPCYLVRGSYRPTKYDFTGLDDEETPLTAIKAEAPSSVADLCTGRGLTLLAAHEFGTTFYGIELNRRRLAVAIDRAAQRGVRYEKYNL